MLRSMSWEQFIGWVRYYELEPFGEDRADLRAGIIASVIANVNRDSKKRPTPFTPADFMPQSVQGGSVASRAALGPRKPLTDLDQWRQLKRALRATSGRKPTKVSSD